MIVLLSVPFVPDTLILVPDDQAETVRKQMEKGNPGRVWSHSEVAALKASGASVEEARKVAEMKQLLKASALWIRPGKVQSQKGLDWQE